MQFKEIRVERDLHQLFLYWFVSKPRLHPGLDECNQIPLTD